MPARRLALPALVCVLLGLVEVSVANAGPVEQLTDLAFGPGNPAALVASYVNGGGGLLYGREGEVPEESYAIPFGEANVVREGDARYWQPLGARA